MAPKVVGNVGHVDGTSSDDVWAVGRNTLGADALPNILHWDGVRWTLSPQDGVKGWGTGVAAISPTDAWMVGYYNGTRPISKHWDGAMWSSVPVPVVGIQNYVLGVTAVASNDVWAGGYYVESSGPLHPLALHWDGTAWTQVPAPDGVPGTNAFYAISAASSDDVWAVGYVDSGFLAFQPLIEHWDGTAWTVVDSPRFPGNDNIVYGVSARASDDAWAVGFQGDSGTELRTLAEHWDGTAWTVVHTPDAPGTLDILVGVDAVSSIDAWAVGDYSPEGSYALPLAEHWDGTRWRVVQTSQPYNSGLGGVRAITATQVWAVGAAFDLSLNDFRPLTMLSKGCSP